MIDSTMTSSQAEEMSEAYCRVCLASKGHYTHQHEDWKKLFEERRETIVSLDQAPPSINHYYGKPIIKRFVSVYVTKEGKQFKKDLDAQVIDQILFAGDLKVTINLTFPTRRKNDIDNYNKAVLDALTGLVYVDDSQIVELHVFKKYVKNKPKTMIVIEELE